MAPSLEAIRVAPTRGEPEKALRTGVESTRARLQHKCDLAAQGCTNFTDYVAQLEMQGVEVLAIRMIRGREADNPEVMANCPRHFGQDVMSRACQKFCVRGI